MTTTTQPNPLVVVAKQCGLAESHPIVVACLPFYTDAAPLVAEAAVLEVTDATQVTEIKKSRELRLALKKIRTGADKCRKEMKEDSLRTSQSIDRVFGAVIKAIDAEEERLAGMEKIAERKEAERKANLKAARLEEIRPYGADLNGIIVEDLPESTWIRMVNDAQREFNERQEEARRAEEARKLREAEAQAERDRLKAENDRLRAEQADKDRKAAEEREKARKEREAVEAEERRKREEAEAVARREREARQKLEREQADRDAATKKKAEEEERARRAAEAAPDAEKIREVAAKLRLIEIREMETEGGQAKKLDIIEQIELLAVYIDGLATELTT